jgi:hypothetical protein
MRKKNHSGPLDAPRRRWLEHRRVNKTGTDQRGPVAGPALTWRMPQELRVFPAGGYAPPSVDGRLSYDFS